MNSIKHLLVLLFVFFTTTVVVNAQNIIDNELLNATISIQYSYNLYSPSVKEAFHAEKQDVTIKGDLLCNVMRFRLKGLVANNNRLANCSYSTHCPVVSGSSKLKVYDDEGRVKEEVNNSLEVSKTVNTLDEKSGKLQTTYTYSAAGTNEMDAINLEIKPYDAPEGQVQPLKPNYVIWLTGGIGFDFSAPRRKPMGNGTGKFWDENANSLVPAEGPFEIVVPSDINMADHAIEANEVYEQLLITNYAEFENYLLNPMGNFTIKASGKRYKYSEGTSEYDGMVTVEIVFSPHAILNPITK
jgi:hypothetical protein